MILYLHTSCLVKLYINEPGTEDVRKAAGMADEVATTLVAESEFRSALARRRRDGLLTPSE